MAETEQTKVCPLCAETIKAAAKVCPHCHYWQKKWSLRNPRTMQSTSAILMAIVMFGGIVGLGYFFEHLLGPKRDFAQYQDDVRVVNSETNFRTVESNLLVSVVGVLTNQSDFGWKHVGVEAQFFDGNSNLIDVIEAQGEYYSGLEILPRSEASFKIEGHATHKEQDYKSTKVFVRTGEDIHTFP